ncbi:hypothetical protein UFOVP274_76 [uncultured Caudovirales phage]|uniref:Uncharacterized protein n=1 Tax=uncultured Caudovirales phage TaxID=2100421 RepID=A0A6J5LPF9_9CAUD|nr:hypothetical protein UFOVP274_76 [uncultured Caudovirales phage]
MITVTEYPHHGPARVWTAADKAEFCRTIMRSRPMGTWEPDWGFKRFESYLRDNLQKLVIEEQQ